MAKSRNPLKDLSDLTEMSIVKNWIGNLFLTTQDVRIILVPLTLYSKNVVAHQLQILLRAQIAFKATFTPDNIPVQKVLKCKVGIKVF